MTSQQILQATVLDILFEWRNKAYSAYLLRKQYPQRLKMAILITVSHPIIFMFFIPAPGYKAATMAANGDVVIREFTAPPETKKPELPKQQTAGKVQVKKQASLAKIEIVQKEVPTEMPPVDALTDAAVSDKTMAGENTGAAQQVPLTETNPAENTGTTTETGPLPEMVPDRQPQFPGGQQAWLAFLTRNLQAPEGLEPGERRTTLIRFPVAADGTITGFQILQSAGQTFDDEVIRVLKKMPRWMPAIKAGQPVLVSFTKPVTFVGMEE